MRSFTKGVIVGVLLSITVGTLMQVLFSRVTKLDSQPYDPLKVSTTLQPSTFSVKPPHAAEPPTAMSVMPAHPTLKISAPLWGNLSIKVEGTWHPVCGNGFWDDDKKIKSACQQMGYRTGHFIRKDIKLEENAVYVGSCETGDHRNACTNGCCNQGCPQNSIGCGNCKRGFPGAFWIACLDDTPLNLHAPVGPIPITPEVRVTTTTRPINHVTPKPSNLVLKGRRCSIELWTEVGMHQSDAEVKCFSDPKCAGLMFQGTTTQGCGGVLLPKTIPFWDVMLRHGLLVTDSGAFAKSTTKLPLKDRHKLGAIVKGYRCSIELWMQVGMQRTDAEAKCYSDSKCQGLMYYAKDGGDGRFVSSGWFQGCGGKVEKNKPNVDWDVLLRDGLQMSETGEITDSVDRVSVCCAPFELGQAWAGWFDRHVKDCCNVVVGVSTGKLYHSTRAVPVFQSWFQRLVPGMFAFFVSDDDETKLPMMILQDESFQKRTMEFLLVMATSPPVRYDWLLLAEDDTFVVPQALSTFASGKSSTEAHFFGSGANLGAGIFMSHATMAVVDHNIDKARREFTDFKSPQYTKVLEHLLVTKLGIPFTDTPQFQADRKILQEGWSCWKKSIVTLHPIMGKQTRQMADCLCLEDEHSCGLLGPPVPGNVWRHVYESRKCTKTLWEANDTNRLDAIRRCEKDELCLGLMEFKGKHGGGECGGSYRGCGGGLDEEPTCSKHSWDIKLLSKINVKHFQNCVECFISPEARMMQGSVYNYEWGDQGRIGNMLMTYWNARAYAFFRGQSFHVNVQEANAANQFLRRFRMDVAPEQPDRVLNNAYQRLAKRDGFSEHDYPHATAAAPWRLLTKVIASETREVLQEVLRETAAPTRDETLAAVYIRCDVDIVGESGEIGTPEYGLLPHRFIGQRLPQTVSKIVLLLGKRNRKSKLCPKAIDDLQSYLERLGLTVEVLEPNDGPLEADWARLSSFQTIFSWPSTFSFTALVGSPHRVFFPYNGASMLFVAPPRSVAETWHPPHENFTWVEIDFLPGRILNTMSWEDIRTYLNSESCDSSVYPCVPVREAC